MHLYSVHNTLPLPLPLSPTDKQTKNQPKMDPTLPCIVQALRATVPTPTQQNPVTPAASARTQSQPSVSRCTRSRAAPDWSVSDTLILIEQIAVVDTESWSKSLSSFQKWKIVSDNCAQIGLNRSSNQCKRRWELLVPDYKKIRRWETKRNNSSEPGPGSVSYWKLDPDWRERFGLPDLFNLELYSAMDAVIKIEGSRDVDSELLVVGPIEHLEGENAGVPLTTSVALPTDMAVPADVEAPKVVENVHAAADLDHKDEEKEETDESLQSDEAWDLATKLQENAEHIQSILRDSYGGDLTISDNVDMAVARTKAEVLIKSLGGLVHTLDEFTELVKSNGLEKVIALNSYSAM